MSEGPPEASWPAHPGMAGSERHASAHGRRGRQGDRAAGHVVLQLTGGTIVPTSTATPLGNNEGHIHLLDNGSVISMAYGTQQDISLTPGPHLLEAEFVASDHLPFNPRVISSVHITAQ